MIDEADRMLDMGFEREMEECLSMIKQRAPSKFCSTDEATKFHSDDVRVNLVSATLSSKLQTLGSKLMKDYKTAGFNTPEGDIKEEKEEALTIPAQIKQFWMECPTQYKLVYLLEFLYIN